MFTLILLSFALAADGFAVSIARGAASDHRWKDALIIGFVFGSIHALMIAIGWFVGDFVEAWKNVAPWIACIVLCLLGNKMLIDAKQVDEAPLTAANDNDLRAGFLGTLIAGLATSIDGAAAGITLPLMPYSLAIDALLVGGITMALSVVGYRMGALLGARWGKYAEYFGGLVLIGIGIKMVVYP